LNSYSFKSTPVFGNYSYLPLSENDQGIGTIPFSPAQRREPWTEKPASQVLVLLNTAQLLHWNQYDNVVCAQLAGKHESFVAAAMTIFDPATCFRNSQLPVYREAPCTHLEYLAPGTAGKNSPHILLPQHTRHLPAEHQSSHSPLATAVSAAPAPQDHADGPVLLAPTASPTQHPPQGQAAEEAYPPHY